ncbi:NAD-dependent deacylase [Lutibacter sp. HS1-25]|uniref:SIR2 family NAD-dependent protein deacylase n=1 Tax=Lutibacter sp. HS1-25 TaxID=2485000 RepID=UPI001011C63A|nr:NAD-dependent deacylase [Lutibacter sp. HS1-25]RXP57088.1 NAD-dependent deacylase [Lutibacter sp. HS1-25]
MKNIVVLTGAGISAESGLKTFRDADGLWEGHDVMEVASIEGWRRDKSIILDFYNQRRAQLLEVEPNKGHQDLSALEARFNVHIITQNVDDLHERAGSTQVIHLHGELFKVRSSYDSELVYEWKKDLNIGDVGEDNAQLRPHIVWFGEEVPLLNKAIKIVKDADALLIIGTSMQVYPAANLVYYLKNNVPIYFIDPRPSIAENSFSNLKIIAENASTGVEKAITELIDLLQ